MVFTEAPYPDRIENGAANVFLNALKRADELVAPSAYLYHYFQNKGFEVRVIENPVDLSEYTFHPKEIIRARILWMRAFTEIYNPEMAIRVAKRLSEKFIDFQMVMAGKDGPLTVVIKKEAEKNGLSGRQFFPATLIRMKKREICK